MGHSSMTVSAQLARLWFINTACFEASLFGLAANTCSLFSANKAPTSRHVRRLLQNCWISVRSWRAQVLNQKGRCIRASLFIRTLIPTLPFSFGEVETHITCSYHWEHPPDEIVIESRPVGDGILQLSLDTTTATLRAKRMQPLFSNGLVN